MGELADDMIEGTTCSLCGQFFVDGPETEEGQPIFTHGYPVVCWECWKSLTKSQRRKHQRALKPTM